MEITMRPIGYVRNNRQSLHDDYWGQTTSTIEIAEWMGDDALIGIEHFSHVEIIFFFHAVDPNTVVYDSRHPRNNPGWPKVGILAQRGKNRPNRIGLTTARVLAAAGRQLTVTDLDAIDGTPILDIKPVLHEFEPQGRLHQPPWATELMACYWEVETKNHTPNDPA